MKRIILLLLVSIIVVFIITGCLRKEEDTTMVFDNVRLVLEGNTLQLYSLSTVYGIELTFYGDIPRESFIHSDQLLMIHKSYGDKTVVALAKMNGLIDQGEKLLSVEGVSSIGKLLLSTRSEQEFEVSASDPLPDGICVVDKTIPPQSDGFFCVHGNLVFDGYVGGIAITLTYDPSYFTVDTTQGNNGITALGTFSQGLIIVDSTTEGVLKIDVAFTSGKQIDDEDMFRVHIQTKDKEGETEVGIDGEVRDTDANVIEWISFTPGIITIGIECMLLGDFNNDCIVDLRDFVMFAQHYNCVEGDNRYELPYDIHPAEMGKPRTAWFLIYCKATPDGEVKLGDFVVFASNYELECPTFTISGYVKKTDGTPVPEVKITFTDIGTTSTNSNGYYKKEIHYLWSGTVTPSKPEFLFTPEYASFSKVTSDKKSDFIAEHAVVREMVLVEGGAFWMGDEQSHFSSPVHEVTLTYDYYIGKYEVTFDEYDAFCDDTGRSKPSDSGWGRGTRPVIYVARWDIRDYCNWLSEKEGLPVAYKLTEEPLQGRMVMIDANGNATTDVTKVVGYRLPTEAEWEYAARGGKHHSPYKYSGSDNVDEVAWYSGNSGGETHEVGLKLPNALGIYDMSGNVCELCIDGWYHYTESPKTNPYYPADPYINPCQIVRGGCWWDFFQDVTLRMDDCIYHETNELGFRITRTVH